MISPFQGADPALVRTIFDALVPFITTAPETLTFI